MFSTKEVVNVTKAAISQLIAKGYMSADDTLANLTALDDQYIVDLGKKLEINSDGDFSLNTPADVMFKSLLSQIGKIIIDNRSYVAALPSLYVDTVNWGLMTEMIRVDLSDVMVDEMWNPDGFINWNGEVRGTTTYTAADGAAEGARIAAIEFGCYKPTVSSRLYSKAKGIMVALTTAREQFFTAFRNEAEWSAFIAALYNSVENTLQVKAEIYALMTVSMGIAKSKANGNMISLRDEYDAVTGNSHSVLSNEALLHDQDFQRYMAMRISSVKGYLLRYTAAYNDHIGVTFSADPRLILLEQAANEIKFGLRANTFNEELVGFGDFDRVAAWQAVKSATAQTAFNFNVASSISLTDAAAEEAGLSEGQGTMTGVVAVLYDRYAMGVTLDKRKVTTQYAASRDTVNSFYHSLINYVVNDSYPIVSFTLNSLST